MIIASVPQIIVGQVDASIEAKLIHAYYDTDEHEKKYINLLNLANYYRNTNIKKADSLVVELINESSYQNDSIRLSALLFKAQMEERRGDITSYISTINKTRFFLDKVKDSAIILQVHKHIGWTAHLTMNDSIALHNLETYRSGVEKIDAKGQIVEAYLLLSRYYMVRQQERLSTEHVNKAIDIANKLKNPAIQAMCYHFQAKISETFEHMDMGVEKGILALKTAIKTQHNALITIILVESGLAEVRFKNFDEAEKFLQQALDRSLLINDEVGRAWARLGMANVHLGRNQIFEALFNAKRAIAVYKQKNCIEGIADAYTTLAQVYKQKKEFELALEQAQNAIPYYQQLFAHKQIAEVHYNIGTILYQQKLFKQALFYFKQAEKINLQHRFDAQLAQVYRSIAYIYQDMQHYKKASYYQRKYIEHIDSTNVVKTMNRAIELNERYKAQQRDEQILKQQNLTEYERKKKEIAVAQLENIRLKNNFQTYIILGFCVVTILVIIILFERYRQQKQMNLQREIEMNLTVLRTQMNPHFIFNTISVIQSFLYDNNVEKSSQILLKFSRLIRLILENSTKKTILIETEEKILTHYLQTQQQRFDNKFKFNIFIAEELKEKHAMIPPMITQPFIENAIEHGQLHHLPQEGRVEIRFEKTVIYHILNSPHAPTTLLEVTIEDNGVGIQEGTRYNKQKEHRSMALEITRERIKYLNMKYRTSGYVKIEDKADYDQMGTKVTLLLPYITEKHK